MSRTRLIFLSIALALVAGPIFAQSGAKSKKPAPAASFESTLKKTKWKTTRLDNGNWQAEIEWRNEKRSQVVIVTGKPGEFSAVKTREIWSLAWTGATLPNADTLAKVLTTRYAIGAFQMEKSDDGAYRIYYRVDLPEDVKAPYLERTISLVAEAADNLEKDLTEGNDDL